VKLWYLSMWPLWVSTYFSVDLKICDPAILWPHSSVRLRIAF
jgi:hypothetical protein